VTSNFKQLISLADLITATEFRVSSPKRLRFLVFTSVITEKIRSASALECGRLKQILASLDMF